MCDSGNIELNCQQQLVPTAGCLNNEGKRAEGDSPEATPSVHGTSTVTEASLKVAGQKEPFADGARIKAAPTAAAPSLF